MSTEFEKKIAKEVRTALNYSTNTEEEARVLLTLVKVLSERKALNHSEGIISALKELLDIEQGIIRVNVLVKERLDEASKALLCNALKEKYSARDIILNESIDERILGGIKLQIGEEVYDATVKNKLMYLAQQLQVTK